MNNLTFICNNIPENYEDLQNQTNKNFDVVNTKIPLSEWASEINKISKTIKTKYFTVVNSWNTLNDSFNNNIEIYANAYSDVSVFLPIILNFEGESFNKTSNEVVWSEGFAQNKGYLDFELLKKFNIFNFNNAVYNTEDFLNNNGFKTSIKKYFEYEFFMRIAYKNFKIMVIPKFMVRNNIDDTNLLLQYNNNLEKMEDKFYLDLSKKEYYFEEDRNIVFKNES